MKVLTTKAELRHWRQEQINSHAVVGFVPTMGALHAGHISLVQQALQHTDIVVASIFVNPTQFNAAADLDAYPRMPEADVQMLEAAGCHALFMPSAPEVYGPADNARSQITIQFPGLDDVLEGTHRPGHFSGVAQVVSKLFHMVQPHKAYFGQKDFQQLAIIQQLVKGLDFNVEVVPAPTLRETDGLAMSSRNLRLSDAERAIAPQIYQALLQVQAHLGTESPTHACTHAAEKWLAAPAFKLEYLQVVHPYTLADLDSWTEGDAAVVVIACWLGQVRLIDNLRINC